MVADGQLRLIGARMKVADRPDRVSSNPRRHILHFKRELWNGRTNKRWAGSHVVVTLFNPYLTSRRPVFNWPRTICVCEHTIVWINAIIVKLLMKSNGVCLAIFVYRVFWMYFTGHVWWLYVWFFPSCLGVEAYAHNYHVISRLRWRILFRWWGNANKE